MNNKAKILTAVVGVIVVGLGVGVTVMQPKTTDLVEPIVPVVVEETVEEIEIIEEEVEEIEEEPTPEEIEIIEEEVEEIEEEPTPEEIEVVEPEPVVVTEPEPIVVTEPEPVVVAEPTPTVVTEPEPVVVTEPEPVVESSGVTYTAVYNGVTYTVTQEQMDRAYLEGFGYVKTDGIPADVFAIADGGFGTTAGTNLGSAGKTDEEMREQWENLTYEAPTAVWS